MDGLGALQCTPGDAGVHPWMSRLPQSAPFRGALHYTPERTEVHSNAPLPDLRILESLRFIPPAESTRSHERLSGTPLAPSGGDRYN